MMPMALPRDRSLVFDEDGDEDDVVQHFDDIKKNLLSTLDSEYKVEQDHVKVYLRVRPLKKEERDKKEDQGCVEIENNQTVIVHAPRDSHTYRTSASHGITKQDQKFTFTAVFDENAGQKKFFDETMLGTVKNFIDGQNCLVFTYGVTNSGKTYTIQGEPRDAGILPRALDVVFNSINGRQYQRMNLKPHMYCDVERLTKEMETAEMSTKDAVMKMTLRELERLDGLARTSSDSAGSAMSQDSLEQKAFPHNSYSDSNNDNEDDEEFCDDDDISTVVANRKREEATIEVTSQGQVRFSVWVSFAELYQEQIYDLLTPVPKKSLSKQRVMLPLRDDRQGMPYIKGLREINVTSADEAYKLLALGKRNLQFACTKLNQSSSRSHCIFTIKMLRVVDKDEPNVSRVSMLSFCDLAGSERTQKTGSERLKETSVINTSLMILSRCLETLRQNQVTKIPKMVPFRESKLTRLFQSYFTGRGRASMIVNISQCASMFDETLNAIKYSALAKQVIVYQAPPPPAAVKRKTAEPEKRQPSLVGGPSSSNNSSTQAGGSRATIGWATPGTIEEMLTTGEMVLDLPLSTAALGVAPRVDRMNVVAEEIGGEEGDTEEYDETETTFGTEADLDDTYVCEIKEKWEKERMWWEKRKEAWEKERKELADMIQGLTEEIRKLLREKAEQAVQIRNEVCEEFKQQFVIIEDSHRESKRKMEERHEERLEFKLALQREATEKNCKRRRLDDGEEFVSSHLLHAEKMKVEKLTCRITELESNVKHLEADIASRASDVNTVSRQRDNMALQASQADVIRVESESRLSDLQAKHTHQVQEFEAELRSLKLELLAVKTSNKLAEDEREMLSHASSKSTQRSAELEARNSKLVSEITAMETNLRLEEAKNSKLAAELIALQEDSQLRYSVLESSMAAVISKTETLHHELEAALSERDASIQENRDTTAQLSALKAKADQSLVELDTNTSKLISLHGAEDALKTMTALRDTAIAENKQLKEKLAEMEAKFLSQTALLESKISDREGIECELRAELKSARVERDAAVEAYLKSSTDLVELQAESNALALDVNRLQREVHESTNVISGLREDLASSSAEAEAYSQQTTGLREAITILTSETESYKQTIVKLRTDLTNAITVSDDLHASANSVTNDLQAYKEQVASLRASLLTAEGDSVKKRDFVSDLEATIARLTAESHAYQEQVARLEPYVEQTSRLQEQLSSVRVECDANMKLASDLQAAITGVTANSKEQNEQLSQLKTSFNSLTAESDANKLAAEESHKEIANLQAELKRLREELKEQTDKNKTDADIIKELNEHVSEKTSSLLMSETKISELKHEIVQQTDLNKALQYRLDNVSVQKAPSTPTRSTTAPPPMLHVEVKREVQPPMILPTVAELQPPTHAIAVEVHPMTHSVPVLVQAKEISVSAEAQHATTQPAPLVHSSPPPAPVIEVKSEVRRTRRQTQKVNYCVEAYADYNDVDINAEFENALLENAKNSRTRSARKASSTVSKLKLLKPVEHLDPHKMIEPVPEVLVDILCDSATKSQANLPVLSVCDTPDNSELLTDNKVSPERPRRKRKMLNNGESLLIGTPCPSSDPHIIPPSPHNTNNSSVHTTVLRNLRQRKQ